MKCDGLEILFIDVYNTVREHNLVSTVDLIFAYAKGV